MNEPTQLTEKFSSQIKWETNLEKYKELTEWENKLLAETQGETKSSSKPFVFNINPKINIDLLAYGAKHKTTIIIFEYFYKTDTDLNIFILTKIPSMELGTFDRQRIIIPLEMATGNDTDLLLTIFASLKEDYNLDALVNYEDHIEFKLNDDEMFMFFFDPETLPETLLFSFIHFGISQTSLELSILFREGTGLIGIVTNEKAQDLLEL